MYINEFVAGILVTIFAELVLIVGTAIIASKKNDK